MPKQHRYPESVYHTVNARLPKEVLDAMDKWGWNVFGVYEVVKKELTKEKRAKAAKR